MAQLHVQLTDEQIEALQRVAKQQHTPVSELIRRYVDYLLAGGTPVSNDLPTGTELAVLAEHGLAFDWLADEPDLYSPDDGEPV